MISQINKTGLKTRLFILILPCLFAITAFTQSVAQSMPTYKTAEKVGRNDPNAVELGEFIKRAENELKKAMLVGDEFAHVKVRVPKGINKLDYSKLLSVLDINDFTAVRTNELIKVIPRKDARNSANPVVEPNGKYYDDEFVTDFITLSKTCASKILPAIRPLIPPHSHLAYSQDRLLIVTDTYGNIKRVKKIVEKTENGMKKRDDCQSLESPKK